MALSAKKVTALRAVYAKAYGEPLEWSDDLIQEAIDGMDDPKADVLSVIRAAVMKDRILSDKEYEAEEEAQTAADLDDRLSHTSGMPTRVRPLVAALNASTAFTKIVAYDAKITVAKKVMPLETMDILVLSVGSEALAGLPIPDTFGKDVERKRGTFDSNNPAVISIAQSKGRPRIEDFYIETLLGTDYGRALLDEIKKVENNVERKNQDEDTKSQVNTLKGKIRSGITLLKRSVACWHMFDNLTAYAGVGVDTYKTDKNGVMTWDQRNEPIVIFEEPMTAKNTKKKNLTVTQFLRLSPTKARAIKANAKVAMTHYDALLKTLQNVERDLEFRVTPKNMFRVLKGMRSFLAKREHRDAIAQIMVHPQQDVQFDFNSVLAQLGTSFGPIFDMAKSKVAEVEKEEATKAAQIEAAEKRTVTK